MRKIRSQHIGWLVLWVCLPLVAGKGRPIRTMELQHPVRAVDNVKTVAFLIEDHELREGLDTALVAGFLNDGRVQVVGHHDLQRQIQTKELVLDQLPARAESQVLNGILGERAVLLHLRILKQHRQRFRRGFFPANQALTRITYQAAAQIQILKTGKRLEPQFIEVFHEVPDSALKGTPREKVQQVIRERSLLAFYQEVAALFLPVTERVEILFHNDKAVRMREMAERINHNDTAQALDIGLQAAAAGDDFGEIGTEDQSKLHFNIGGLYLLERRFDKAVFHLERAHELHNLTEGLAVLLSARRAAAYFDREPFHLEEDRERLLNLLRRLKHWRKEQLIDEEEYRRQRITALEGYRFDTNLPMAERLVKARSLYQEKLVSEKEYKLLKNKILESAER